MKILTVVGARPQFIKAAAVSRVIRQKYQEILLHTGQHYDTNMSKVFFEELDIPKPDISLGVGSGSHAVQTAKMLTGIEEALIKEKPKCILVYGDTNSTLAGALAAAKIHIPVVHVEAGLRSYNMYMPEELNRVLTDRVSTLLMCPTDSSVINLQKEGITSGVYLAGDVMCDAVYYYSEQMQKKEYTPNIQGLYNQEVLPIEWYMATIHRAENTDNIDKINEILMAFQELDSPVIFPVHPRTQNLVDELTKKYNYKNIKFIQPLGYLDMIYLVQHSKKTITDSGGLQKETYLLDVPCITVREETEWVETLNGNYNILAKPIKEDILEKVYNIKVGGEPKRDYYGNGHASEVIRDKLNKLDI